MSGVYIKGLEMPTSCSGCAFERFENGYGDYCVICPLPYENANDQIEHRETERMEWCPLIPVPPHGRLIDADEAIGHLFNGEQCLYCWDEIEDAIDATATIIPADKENNNG